MNKISFNHFKAFSDVQEISNISSSQLIYGENGSGKSSIYEGLRLAFYHTRMESELPASLIGQMREQRIRQEYLVYNNKKAKKDFEIKVDEINFREFDASPYDAFLVSTADIKGKTELKVRDIFSNLNFPHKDGFNLYDRENLELIETHVNSVLETIFLETVKVELDQTGEFFNVSDDNAGITFQQRELNKYFNEAKINILTFIIVMSAIELLVRPQLTKEYRYLILDDIVTSFDSANRVFFIRYIQSRFKEYIKIILTHNINFYNLFKYTIEDKVVYNESSVESWQYLNIYTCGGIHKLNNIKVSSIDSIKEEWKDGNLANMVDVGNKIRQRFEMLLYELAKKMHLGAIEESKQLLDLLFNDKPLYITRPLQPSSKQPSTIYDMVTEIVKCSEMRDASKYKTKILGIIEKYKANDELQKLKPIMSELVLYQKAALHPASHGHADIPPFSNSEIDRSILLLEKLDKIITNIPEHIGAL